MLFDGGGVSQSIELNPAEMLCSGWAASQVRILP